MNEYLETCFTKFSLLLSFRNFFACLKINSEKRWKDFQKIKAHEFCLQLSPSWLSQIDVDYPNITQTWLPFWKFHKNLKIAHGLFSWEIWNIKNSFTASVYILFILALVMFPCIVVKWNWITLKALWSASGTFSRSFFLFQSLKNFIMPKGVWIAVARCKMIYLDDS